MDGSAIGLDNSHMNQLPAYALYGEPDRSPAADPLHCESIAERSRLHDWEIRPHRHASLFQLLVVARGRGSAALDGNDLALVGPALVTVPPLAAHGFRFAPAIDGLVFTVIDSHLQRLLGGDAALAAALRELRAWQPARGDAATREVLAAARALRDEVQRDARWRAAAIDAALLRLLVAVARVAPAASGAGTPPQRALNHLRRFRALVDERFRSQPSLAVLAAEIGITPTQLNRVCRQVLGRPALALLHERLALEAQRDLAYTTMSVKQVASQLGFADAAYFTRFFQRQTGSTPTAWRQARAGQTRSSTTAMPWPTPMHIVHSA